MKVNRSKLSPIFLCGILLTLFFGVALFLRVYLPYDKVFTTDWIKFTGADAYYHMRLVDNLVHNFPHLTAFDAHLLYTVGTEIGTSTPFWLALSPHYLGDWTRFINLVHRRCDQCLFASSSGCSNRCACLFHWQTAVWPLGRCALNSCNTLLPSEFLGRQYSALLITMLPRHCFPP